MNSKQNKIIKIFRFIFSSAILTAPFLVFAQIQNPLKGSPSLASLAATLFGYVVKVGGVIAVGAFIYVGFLYVKAQGRPEKISEAHKALLNTFIGVAILLGAQIIASIIYGTISTLH